MMRFIPISLIAAALAFSACTQAAPEPEAPKHRFADRYVDWPAYEGVALWRLYRTEVGGGGKVALATFDSLAGKQYTPGFNQNTCETAAELMQAEDNYNRRHWCEEAVF